MESIGAKNPFQHRSLRAGGDVFSEKITNCTF